LACVYTDFVTILYIYVAAELPVARSFRARESSLVITTYRNFSSPLWPSSLVFPSPGRVYTISALYMLLTVLWPLLPQSSCLFLARQTYFGERFIASSQAITVVSYSQHSAC